MALSKRVIPIRIKGLDTKSSQDLGPATDIDNMFNMMATKTTDGGYEFRKRFGVTSLVKTIEGGGSISAGFKICSLNNELIITDGNFMYSYSSILNKWIKKGYVCDIACNIATISTSGDSENTSFSNRQIDTDVAYLSGYACFTSSRDPANNGTGEWYVIDRSTGNMVGNGPINTTTTATNARVVGVGTAFYIFYYTGTPGTTLACRKIDIATPDVISAATNVTATFNATCIYDVIADVTNTRILVSYRATAGAGTTIMVWNTNMTAGASATYATRDPTQCIGFLDDVAPARVAVGTSATGVRVLTFNTTTMAVTVDTLVDGAATDAIACTGYYSGAINVLYTRPGAASRDDVTSLWSAGTGAVALRSVSLQSRPFTLGTPGGAGKRYVLVGHNEDITVVPWITANADRVRALFLLQLDQDGATTNSCRIAGTITPGNWGGAIYRNKGLGSFAVVSSTSVIVSCSMLTGPTATISGATTFLVQSVDLDFSGNSTGNPAAFNNTMFFPGCATKVYDGRNVFENGFYHRPDQPVLTRLAGGGTMTAGVVQMVIVCSYIDSNGKLWRSSPSGISSVTVALNDRIQVVMPNMRITDRTSAIAITDVVNEAVKVELYVTKPNQSIFYYSTSAFNDTTADSQTITLSSDQVGSNEILYTQSGPLPNEYPGAVLAACAHNSRMFFMCGDRSVWFTREIENDEDMPGSSSLFRVQMGTELGALTGIASIDTGLVISRKTRINILTGQGPAKDGSNPYQPPQTLPVDVGFNNVHSFCGTPDGIIFQSQKSFQFLSRSGNVEPVYGMEDYESATTITGAVALDGYPFIVFSGTPATSIVWDWQFKIWYRWANGTELAAASVSKWQGSLVYLKSDGTVNKQTANTWNDNSNAVPSSINFGWVAVGDIFHNSRVYNIQFLMKAMASFTLNSQIAYDYDLSSPESRTLAVTSSSMGVFMIRPSTRRMQSFYVQLSENSTTEGFRITAFGIECGMKPGSRKQATSRFLT